MSDLLRENLDIVFCGTAKGKKSAATGTYYADKTNKFYKVLHEAGLTDHQLKPEDFGELLSFGIGLTDLNQTECGTDKQISMKNCDSDGFRAKMLKYTPKAIAFTSIKAGQVYFKSRRIQCGEQSGTLSGIKIVVLPSTSGLNGYWNRDKHHWYTLPSIL